MNKKRWLGAGMEIRGSHSCGIRALNCGLEQGAVDDGFNPRDELSLDGLPRSGVQGGRVRKGFR